jgi:hypothetical protein
MLYLLMKYVYSIGYLQTQKIDASFVLSNICARLCTQHVSDSERHNIHIVEYIWTVAHKTYIPATLKTHILYTRWCSRIFMSSCTYKHTYIQTQKIDATFILSKHRLDLSKETRVASTEDEVRGSIGLSIRICEGNMHTNAPCVYACKWCDVCWCWGKTQHVFVCTNMSGAYWRWGEIHMYSCGFHVYMYVCACICDTHLHCTLLWIWMPCPSTSLWRW